MGSTQLVSVEARATLRSNVIQRSFPVVWDDQIPDRGSYDPAGPDKPGILSNGTLRLRTTYGHIDLIMKPRGGSREELLPNSVRSWSAVIRCWSPPSTTASQVLVVAVISLWGITCESGETARGPVLFLVEKYQVSAGVIEDGLSDWPCRGWLHRERHTKLLQPFVLFMNVMHGKRRMRYALFEYPLLVSLGNRVVVWFEKQLDVIRALRGDNG